ncbi:MAG: hypothetical protein QT00_C0002G0313 [archaeon GW2011_AR5]|nr:MAG: hypothetical protein QT00_C0002G0313 [archaeon GW2011_AR5]
MGAIFEGIGIGFFAALFISLYAEGIFNSVLPFWLIYGILAPLFAAIVIAILTFSKKDERDRNLEWFEEKKDE